MRNFFVNYRGGAASRAGSAYVGMCKQGAPNIGGTSTSNPPRDIPFQFSLTQGYALEFGDQYMRVKSNGAYVTETAITVTSVSAAALFTTTGAHGLSVGDWVYDLGNTGFNGLTWVVKTVPTGTTFTVSDLFGNVVSTATASTGGTVARIYTAIAPYAAIDLPYLKYTQSADTMTLCCVNQKTGTEYTSYELVRNAVTNWTFTPDSFSSAIIAPTNVSVAANASTTTTTYYSYVVTAVSNSGEESIASLAGGVQNNDIAVFAGSNVISWKQVAGATSYNIYKATPVYGSVPVPIGSSYGYAGTAFGNQFVDTNITADFTNVPPVHNNPFSRGAIGAVVISANGTGYTQATVGYTITTSTGTGFAGVPVVNSGGVGSFIITNGGSGYLPGDTIAFTDSGAGTGATATLTVGPETGTYPSVCAYYQQRRVYANTVNNPDTYYMSQPGAFNNMDSSIPVTAADAIVGSPWAQQINGIQFLQPMPGGLVVLTGGGAWQVNGGNSSALTPSDQDAQPQAYNGCNNLVPPITINYDILYVQSKGSIVRDLSYNFFVNIYTGTDTTVLSNQLFNNYTISQWAYAEEPYKLVWCVRNDGTMLSLTYLKEQEVQAWSRHDTDGLYVGVCVVTEPPVDAVYTLVNRYIQGHWVYYSERFNNRLWSNSVENAWCVDAGLSYPMNYPSATLSVAAATGTNNITSATVTSGGHGYASVTLRAVDPTNTGTGWAGTAVLTSGVITSVIVTSAGQNYAAGTQITVSDPTGVGAVIVPVITNNVMFTASSGVFNVGMVGNVIRTGGGKATITTYISTTQVIANITQPITSIIPNNPNSTPVPQTSGNWSIAVPTTTVTGLNHLEGQTVAILADGSVVPNQVVTNGTVTISPAASAITIGLPFTCQLQSMYLDVPSAEGTTQGKRKNTQGVTLRVESSRGLTVGTNQVDAQTQPNNANVPWTGMREFKERTALITAGSAIPLFTGDEFIYVDSDWDEKGQIAVQQTYPLPANILSQVLWYSGGDSAG